MGPSGVRHGVQVEAESLFEAAVIAVRRFRDDIWSEQVAAGTRLDVEVREPATLHSVTFEQVERWLKAPSSPYDASKKAKLRLLLMRG
jgi:hypothetical protein